MKHVFKVTSLVVALCAASAPAQSPPSGRAVLIRSLQVTGADTVLPKHASLKMSGTFVSSSSEFGGTISNVRTSTGEFHWAMDVDGYGRIENGYADGAGYSINEKTGTELLAGSRLAQVRAQAVWLDTPDNYLSITNTGALPFNGKDAYRLELTSKDGVMTTRFFDVVTGLPLGRATRMNTPDGMIEVQQIMSDYKNIGGMLIPTTLRQVGGSGQIVTFDKIEWDGATPADFALPDAVTRMKQFGLNRIEPK